MAGVVAGKGGKDRVHRSAASARLTRTAAMHGFQGVPAIKDLAWPHADAIVASLGERKLGHCPIGQKDLAGRADDHDELGHGIDDGA